MFTPACKSTCKPTYKVIGRQRNCKLAWPGINYTTLARLSASFKLVSNSPIQHLRYSDSHLVVTWVRVMAPFLPLCNKKGSFVFTWGISKQIFHHFLLLILLPLLYSSKSLLSLMPCKNYQSNKCKKSDHAHSYDCLIVTNCFYHRVIWWFPSCYRTILKIYRRQYIE